MKTQLNIFDPPDMPGYRRTETSYLAARDMRLRAPVLRAMCLDALRQFGPMTADQVAEAIGKDRLAVRPRITELKRSGSIEKTGERRENVSGKAADVWRVT